MYPAQADAFRVSVMGEGVEIPYRTHFSKWTVGKCVEVPGIAGRVAQCLGTRHFDGFTRERCLRMLIRCEEPWVVPFVVQLLGEYVLEIVQVIDANLESLNAQLYGDFIRANSRYFGTQERRVVSYWNEYYRGRYPKLSAYPGSTALDTLKGFARAG